MANIQLNATARALPTPELQTERMGKSIPGIVYGSGKGQTAVFVKQIEAIKAFRDAGESTVVDLVIEGGETIPVLIHEVQLDPVSDLPIHFDFLRVDMKKMVHTHIELRTIGEAPAIKAGHIIVKQIEELEVEGLPSDLVGHIDVDVSALAEVGDDIKVSELNIPAGIKVLADADQVVVGVIGQRHEAVEVKPVAEEVAAEVKDEKAETKEA